MSLPSSPTHPVSPGFSLKSSVTESILSRKIKYKSRPKTNYPPSPPPTPSISRLQSFGRNCLNSFSRNKDQPTKNGMPIIQHTPVQKSPVRQRKSSGPSRPDHSRRRPLSQFVYCVQKPSSRASSSTSSSSTFYKTRPHSTFVDSPVIFSSNTTKNHTLSNTSLSSSSSSSCCSTLSSSNTSSKSEFVKTLHRHQSTEEELTALDFLLDDRSHQDNGHHSSTNSLALDEQSDLFFSPTRRNFQQQQEKKGMRMSVPVRSCSSLFQPARKQKQKQNPPMLVAMGEKYHSEPTYTINSVSLPSSTCSLQLTNGNNDLYGNANGKNRKRLTSFESPILIPSRARSVLGIKDHQQKEEKALMAWRASVTQLDKHHNNSTFAAHRQVQWHLPAPKKLDVKTELKWLAYRKFIINEIYSTEKSYHELLLLVKKRYMIPMLAASRVKDPLVKFNDIPILFNHLSTLIELCEKILAGFILEEKEDTLASAASSIGYQWLQLHDDWAVFLKYAVHYEVNTKTIKRACNNALLLKIEQESLTRKETNRMGMSDYLIAPIQRVPRYCLLLKDLLRHTPTTDADYQYLVKVVHSMIGLAKAMNDTQKLHRRKTINI